MGNSSTPHSIALRQQTAAARQARILKDGGKRISPIILEKEFASLWVEAVKASGGNSTEALRELLRNHKGLGNTVLVEQVMADAASNFTLAAETLAKFSGYLNATRLAEQHAEEPSLSKIAALTDYLDVIAGEREQLFSNPALVDRVLYIYAPLLRAAYQAGLPDAAWLSGAADKEAQKPTDLT